MANYTKISDILIIVSNYNQSFIYQNNTKVSAPSEFPANLNFSGAWTLYYDKHWIASNPSSWSHYLNANFFAGNATTGFRDHKRDAWYNVEDAENKTSSISLDLKYGAHLTSLVSIPGETTDEDSGSGDAE